MFIEPTTEEVAKSITIRAGQSIQVRGDIGSYTIPIEISDGAGGWDGFTEDEDDGPVQLSITRKQMAAFGNCLIRINKPETSVSIGIAII